MPRTLGKVGFDMYFDADDLSMEDRYPERCCHQCGDYTKDGVIIDGGRYCLRCAVIIDQTCAECGTYFNYQLTESYQGRVDVEWKICDRCMFKLCFEKKDIDGIFETVERMISREKKGE